MNNRFIAEDTAGSGRAISIRGLGGSHTSIRDNYIFGQYDTVGDTSNGAAVIGVDSTDTQDVVGLEIVGNTIVATDTAAASIFRIADGGTYAIRGIAHSNHITSYDSGAVDSSKFATGNTGAGFGLRMVNNFIASADSQTEKRVGDTMIALS